MMTHGHTVHTHTLGHVAFKWAYWTHMFNFFTFWQILYMDNISEKPIKIGKPKDDLVYYFGNLMKQTQLSKKKWNKPSTINPSILKPSNMFTRFSATIRKCSFCGWERLLEFCNNCSNHSKPFQTVLNFINSKASSN